jgi:hypothetical protein
MLLFRVYDQNNVHKTPMNFAKAMLFMAFPIVLSALTAKPAHAQKTLEECRNGKLFVNGSPTSDQWGTCKDHDKDGKDLKLLILDAPRIPFQIENDEDPPCRMSTNMAREVEKHLSKAAKSLDGIGDDSKLAGWMNKWGPTRSAETQHAACRIVAIALPVGLREIARIRVVVHQDNDDNGDDSYCPDLEVVSDKGTWMLRAADKNYPTPWKVGCPGGYSVIESLEALQMDGKGFVAATFKNWGTDTSRTLQFWVWYRRSSRK